MAATIAATTPRPPGSVSSPAESKVTSVEGRSSVARSCLTTLSPDGVFVAASVGVVAETARTNEAIHDICCSSSTRASERARTAAFGGTSATPRTFKKSASASAVSNCRPLGVKSLSPRTAAASEARSSPPTSNSSITARIASTRSSESESSPKFHRSVNVKRPASVAPALARGLVTPSLHEGSSSVSLTSRNGRSTSRPCTAQTPASPDKRSVKALFRDATSSRSLTAACRASRARRRSSCNLASRGPLTTDEPSRIPRASAKNTATIEMMW